MIGFHFRSSAKIGTGHARRSAVLAHKLADSGLPIILFSDEETIAFSREYMPASCIFIEAEPSAFDFLAVVSSYEISMLILDTYGLAFNIERALYNTIPCLVVIADVQDRQRSCDILIDQNLGRYPEGWLPYVLPNTKILAGPEYALLRSEFLENRALVNRDCLGNQDIPRVLICFGGIDSIGITYNLIQKLTADFGESICIDVILGSGSVYLEEVKEYVVNRAHLNLYIDSNDIASLMARATISIGASGSMSLERCCLSLPSILISVADNQIESGKIAEEIGIGRYLGNYHRNIVEKVSTELRRLINKKPDLEIMSDICRKTVDGGGAQRVSKILMNEWK